MRKKNLINNEKEEDTESKQVQRDALPNADPPTRAKDQHHEYTGLCTPLARLCTLCTGLCKPTLFK
jgi:hypothetical protein